jgi:serralysin
MATIYGSEGDDDGEWHWLPWPWPNFQPALVGTDEGDEIYGRNGNDELIGLDGDDYLDGEAGVDHMNGGFGDDVYVVDDYRDVTEDLVDYYDANGNPINAGYDIVMSYVDYILDLNTLIEELDLIEGSAATIGGGNELNNVIRGNSRDNDLVGDIGDDTLYGNDGDDVLFGDGDDRGPEATVAGSQGAGRDWLYGGADNDTLKGGDGDDHLYGGSHGDSLFGGADNDVLDGGTGGDKMRGESGDDKYYVDNALDEVIEGFDAGSDKVFSSVTFALSPNVENLTLLDGSGAIDGTGNDLDNDIIGNDSNNTIHGLGGADRIYAEEGEDTVYGDDGGDAIHGGTQGDDLFGGRHNDTLYGEDGDDFLSGGADNDTLYGGADQDELVGGSGSDAMSGSTGNDIYWVDNAGDTVTEYASQGVDTVHVVGLIDYTLTANVENLVLEALARNGTGNAASNGIVGNNLGNTINGGLGSDTLTGGGGHDTFVFNTSLAKVPNIDTITDFNADTIQLDNSVFTALIGDQRSVTFAEFRVGSGALDASDRIIYNNQTGALLYDADGTGAQGAVQFATLDAGLFVTGADFWIV